jgi:5-methylcytosine-specific restriction endonuclease McrA
MSGPENISKIDRLRARDGEKCWLCDGPLDFDAVPNSKKAPTYEHLIAKSRGGLSTVENLVLCHPGCNKQLSDRPLVDKIKMRERRRRKSWIAALRSQ